METRKEFSAVLAGLAVSESVQDLLVAETAQTRHHHRARTALAAARNGRSDASAWLLLWLEGFFPEPWSQRGEPFCGLGKGRRHASDGDAWSAAIRDAARKLVQSFRPSADGHTAECSQHTPRLEPSEADPSKMLLVVCDCGEEGIAWEIDPMQNYPGEQLRSALTWALMLAIANVRSATAFAWLSDDNSWRKQVGMIPDKDHWGVGTILRFGGTPERWGNLLQQLQVPSTEHV